MNRLSERANRAIRSHVEMQLRDQFAGMNERLDKLEEAVTALHATLSTIQAATTEISTTFSDRIRTVEAALEHARSTAPTAPTS